MPKFAFQWCVGPYSAPHCLIAARFAVASLCLSGVHLLCNPNICQAKPGTWWLSTPLSNTGCDRGGMFSRLSALVGGGSSLPFELGDQLPSSFGSWQHYRGTSRADGSPVSVFRLAAAGKSDSRLEAGRHGVKRLRTLRHPAVLQFKDSVEVEEKGEAVLYLVTEAVTPLAEVLRSMRGADREQYLCMGLSYVVAALSFLANDCALIHGAVSMAAVVVTHTLDWKLHGFDLVSDHQFASQYDLPLTAAKWLVPQQYQPGEVAKGDWQVGSTAWHSMAARELQLLPGWRACSPLHGSCFRPACLPARAARAAMCCLPCHCG